MKKEVKVGLFAILMLLIGWGVIRVLKGADLFGNTNTYYAYYEQVGGLQEASQVLFMARSRRRISTSRWHSSWVL